jgi:hypothetical protein
MASYYEDPTEGGETCLDVLGPDAALEDGLGVSGQSRDVHGGVRQPPQPLLELLAVLPEEGLVDEAVRVVDGLDPPEARVQEVLERQGEPLDLSVPTAVDPLPALARLEATVQVLTVPEVQPLDLVKAGRDVVDPEGDL